MHCILAYKIYALCSLSLMVNTDRYTGVQELRSLLRDLIPELILSQKLHIHMGQEF